MTKKNDPRMKGFEEVMDFVDPKKRSQNKNESYAAYSFLEQEQSRLIAMDELLSKKFTTLKRYPQTEQLLIKESGKRNLLKLSLAEKLIRDDSPLNEHLAQIFNSAFK